MCVCVAQVDPKMVKAVQTACKLYNVRNVDLWSNLLVRVCCVCVCVCKWISSAAQVYMCALTLVH